MSSARTTYLTVLTLLLSSLTLGLSVEAQSPAYNDNCNEGETGDAGDDIYIDTDGDEECTPDDVKVYEGLGGAVGLAVDTAHSTACTAATGADNDTAAECAGEYADTATGAAFGAAGDAEDIANGVLEQTAPVEDFVDWFDAGADCSAPVDGNQFVELYCTAEGAANDNGPQAYTATGDDEENAYVGIVDGDVCMVCYQSATNRIAVNAGPDVHEDENGNADTAGMLVANSPGFSIDIDNKQSGGDDSIQESGMDPTHTAILVDAPTLSALERDLGFPDRAPLSLTFFHIKWTAREGEAPDVPYTKYSNLDDDFDSDLAELTCAGQPTNPTNQLAHCADWDGDGIDNTEDSQPRVPYFDIQLVIPGVDNLSGSSVGVDLTGDHLGQGEAPQRIQFTITCEGAVDVMQEIQWRYEGGAWNKGVATNPTNLPIIGNIGDGDADRYNRGAVGSDSLPNLPCDDSYTFDDFGQTLVNPTQVARNVEFQVIAKNKLGETLPTPIQSFTLLPNELPDVTITQVCTVGQGAVTTDPCAADHGNDLVSYTYTVTDDGNLAAEDQNLGNLVLANGIDSSSANGHQNWGMGPVDYGGFSWSGWSQDESASVITWTGTFTYAQGATIPAPVVTVTDTGAAKIATTLPDINVPGKLVGDVELFHDPRYDVEQDFEDFILVGWGPVVYNFYFTATGYDGDGSDAILYLDHNIGTDTPLGPSVDSGIWIDTVWEGAHVVECGDYSTYPGYDYLSAGWLAQAGQSDAASIGGSTVADVPQPFAKTTAKCNALQDGETLLYFRVDNLNSWGTVWTGVDSFVYDFEMSGAISPQTDGEKHSYRVNSEDYVYGNNYFVEACGIDGRPADMDDMCPAAGEEPPADPCDDGDDSNNEGCDPCEGDLSDDDGCGEGFPNPIAILTNPECNFLGYMTGGDPDCEQESMPGDYGDYHDTDGDGNEYEDNGQVDYVENYVLYTTEDDDGSTTVHVVADPTTGLTPPSEDLQSVGVDGDGNVKACGLSEAAAGDLCPAEDEGGDDPDPCDDGDDSNNEGCDPCEGDLAEDEGCEEEEDEGLPVPSGPMEETCEGESGVFTVCVTEKEGLLTGLVGAGNGVKFYIGPISSPRF